MNHNNFIFFSLSIQALFLITIINKIKNNNNNNVDTPPVLEQLGDST